MSLLNKMWINHLTNRIEWLLFPITTRLDRIMAKIEDLDAALAANDTALNSLNDNLTALATASKQVDADIQALIAKVNAGTTPTDVAAELSRVQAETAKISAISSAVQGVTQNLTADDAAANPPVETPAPVAETPAPAEIPAPVETPALAPDAPAADTASA